MPEVNVCAVNCAINSTDAAELLERLVGTRRQFEHEQVEWTEEERERAKIFEQILGRWPETPSGHWRCKHCGSLF